MCYLPLHQKARGKPDMKVNFFLGPQTEQYDRTGRPAQISIAKEVSWNDDLDNVDFISSNVNSSRKEALLYTCEDNEAVIKMIIKGRSPTMRHVSRTHRVAPDRLLDRINLEPQIQIKYIDTKNQLADILTKGNVTRDEWKHLLCLFNISHFGSTVCSGAMAKNVQQDSGEESHSKVKTNDESDCKGSLKSVIFCIRKPGEEKL